jgi:hypothetical protein
MAINPLAKIPDEMQAPPPPALAAMPELTQPASPVLAKQPQTPLQQNITQDQAELQKVRMAKARPWGFEGAPPSAEFPEGLAPNHPGKLGKMAHVFSQIGNIAGDVFAPATMANIPGTQMNRQMQEGHLAKRLNIEQGEEVKNEGEQATTAKTKEETTEMPGKSASEEALQGAETEEKRASLDSPSLAAGYAHAVNQAIKEHRDPAQDPIVQHLSDAITSLQKESPGKGFSHVNVQGPNGKPILGNYNSSTGKTTDAGGKEIANPAPYEKPISVNVGRGEEHKEKGEIIKAYQPTLDSAERMNVMTENYEKAIKDHDQQAMLSLLANHLGMTMGLQKGSRLTRDIIREAQQSTPWLQGLQAKFDSDGYLTGVTLTPSQMRQMVGLGQSRYAEDAKKSRAVSQYLGATDDGPERSPGKATVRYYLGMTNGDPAKAKQIAAEDGWSVK